MVNGITQEQDPFTPSNEIFMETIPGEQNELPFSDVIAMDPLDEPAVTLSTDVVNQRAEKYEFALDGQLDTGDIIDSINTGTEGDLREQVSFQEEDKLRTEKNRIISDIALSTGDAVKDTELFAVASLSDVDFKFNPKTIIEKLYGEKIATRGATQVDSELVKEAFNKEPTQSNFWIDLASDVVSKKELSLKKLEELEARNAKLESGEKVFDFVLTGVPFFAWTAEESILNEAGDGIDLPGDNIREKVQFLWSLPPDQFELFLTRALEGVESTSPQIALNFAGAVLSYSSSDQNLDNLFGVLDLTIVPGLGVAALRKIVRTAKAARARRAITEGREAVSELRTEAETLRGASGTKEAETAASEPVRPSHRPPERPRETELLRHKTFEDFSQATRDANKDPVAEARRLNIPQDEQSFGVAKRLVEKRLGLNKKRTDPEPAPKTTEQPATQADVVANTLRSVVKATATRETRAEDILAAAGDVEQSAFESLKKDIFRSARQGVEEKSLKELFDDVPMIFDPGSFLNKPSKLALERKQRLADQLEGGSTNLLNSLLQVSTISRLQGQALDAALENGARRFNVDYPGVDERVLGGGPKHLPAEEAPLRANIDRLEWQIGNKDKDLYKDPDLADFEAREIIGLKDYSVRPQGSGWYISVVRNIDETVPAVLGKRLETRGETPINLINQFTGMLRTPEGLLSPKARSDRLASTFGGQELLRFMSLRAKEIGALRGKDLEQFTRYLEGQRDWIDRKTKEVGRFDSNVGELEANWERKFKEYPNEKIIEAYTAFRQFSDYDLLVRNLSTWRGKARQNIVNWQYKKARLNEETGQIDDLTSELIEGKQVDSIPWNHPNDVGVLVVDYRGGKEVLDDKFYRSKNKFQFQGRVQKDVNDLVENKGFRVVQLTPQGEHTLKKGDKQLTKLVGPNKIHFLVTNSAEQRALGSKHVPKRTGLHVEYNDGFFLSQPIMIRTGPRNNPTWRYEGDVNLHHFTSEKEAKKFELRYREAQRLLEADKIDELEKFLKKNLPYDLKTFRKLYNEGPLKLGAPIRLRANGENLAGRYDLTDQANGGFRNFENSIESSLNLYNSINLKFQQSRDPILRTIVTEGTAEAPIYNLRPAKLLDPVNVLERSAEGLVNNRLFDDLKINAAQDYILQFRDVFLNKGRTVEELLGNPFKALFDEPLDPNFKDRTKLAAARNMRRSTKELLGLKSEIQKSADFTVQRLADMTEGKRSEKLVTGVEWAREKDPAKFLRGSAFHLNLGLGSIEQFLLQMQTFAVTTGIAGPRRAFESLPAAWFSRTRLGLDRDPKMWDFIDDKMTRFGWKKGEFRESQKAMEDTGLYNIGREVAFRGDISYKLSDSFFGTFLDKASFFFKEGERFTRLAAWHTAYREWRVANPGSSFNREAIDTVRQRMDLLTVNMTRASNASWGKGLATLPTQFFAYQTRLSEIALGKRITGAERARLFATMSLMYGIPIGVAGTAFPFWPAWEEFRQGLLERNIDWDDNVVFEILGEGLPNALLKLTTGTDLNFEERFGTSGFPILKEFVNALQGDRTGDKIWIDYLMGPSANFPKAMLKSVEPFTNALISVFHDEIDPILGEPLTYELTIEDFVEPLREIGSVNQAVQAWYAFNYGEYISRNEMNIGNVNEFEALMYGIFGLTPERLTKPFIRKEAMEDRRRGQARAEREVRKWIRRAMRSAEEGDREGALARMKKARAHFIGGGFNMNQWGDVSRRALRNVPFNRAMAWEFQKMFASPETLKQLEQERIREEKELGTP